LLTIFMLWRARAFRRRRGRPGRVVLVEHGDAGEAGADKLAHHGLGFVAVAGADVEDPGVEGAAQGFAAGVGGDQGDAAAGEHALLEQFGDVAGAGIADQRGGLVLADEFLGQAQGFGGLVAVILEHVLEVWPLTPPAALAASMAMRTPRAMAWPVEARLPERGAHWPITTVSPRQP
jgi:hypothetical protein